MKSVHALLVFGARGLSLARSASILGRGGTPPLLLPLPTLLEDGDKGPCLGLTKLDEELETLVAGLVRLTLVTVAPAARLFVVSSGVAKGATV